MPTPLSISLLVTNGGTQSRAKINEETVEDYAEKLSDPKHWPFPPVDVFHDSEKYYVADGFHRVLASQRANRSSIPCEIHKGTAWDALLFGMKANEKHGLRCNNSDKRFRVELLIDSDKKLTQSKISELACVSVRYVRAIIAERKPSPPQEPELVPVTTGGTQHEQDIDDSFPPQDAVDAGIMPPPPKREPEDSKDDLAKKNKTLANSYRDKLVRAICDYHEVKPNRTQRDRLVKLVQGVQLW